MDLEPADGPFLTINGNSSPSAGLVPEIAIRELVATAVPVERFIDDYQSRNERLADIMRRMGVCVEKSSGIDKVIHASEVYPLPPPDFRPGYNRTIAILFGRKDFENMDRGERIRACYHDVDAIRGWCGW